MEKVKETPEMYWKNKMEITKKKLKKQAHWKPISPT